MRFPRQEYWSGFPFPSPGNHLDPGMELVSPALAGRLYFLKNVLYWVFFGFVVQALVAVDNACPFEFR